MIARTRDAAKHAGPVWSVLVILLLLTGLSTSWQLARVLDERGAADAGRMVDQRAALSQTAVQTEIDRYLDALHTLAGAVGAYGRLTDDEYQAATAGLADADLVGATSVAFVVPAADEQIGQVQAYWREGGAAGLTLKQQGSGEHLFSIFVRPLDGGPAGASGIDVTQSAEPTEALTEARRSGQPTMSDPYVLIRDRGLPPAQRQLSFVLTAPVYGLADAVGHRPFRGWISMGLRGQDFVGGVLRDVTQGLVDAALWATGAGGQSLRVAEVDSQRRPDVSRVRTIAVANRHWTLRIAARSGALPVTPEGLPLAAGLGGTTLSVLLAGLIWVLATSRARAQHKVVTATAELRAAEREARQQAAVLNGVLEAISDGVGVVNEHGEFLIHNPAAKLMLGVDDDVNDSDSWQEHYGIFRTDGVTPFPTDELPLVRALAGESTDAVELVIRNGHHPDGMTISVTGRPLDGSSGQHGAVAVFHDITAVREREADLTAFAGIVAHDLKNPLAVIAAHAELAAESLAEGLPSAANSRAAESVRRVDRGVDRMRRLIDDLLAYTTARDAPLRRRPVDLHELVAEIVAERTDHLHGGAGTGIVPDLYVGPLPVVDADPGMLRHVLDNLVGNALKYVAPGRIPRVDISAQPAQPGWVRIEVADRGIGIPDSEKPQVFDSFHRVHAASGYGGTGLGLAICRRVVDRHGGTIGVVDNPGGGSRFSFTLPAGVKLPPAVAPVPRAHEYV